MTSAKPTRHNWFVLYRSRLYQLPTSERDTASLPIKLALLFKTTMSRRFWSMANHLMWILLSVPMAFSQVRKFRVAPDVSARQPNAPWLPRLISKHQNAMMNAICFAGDKISYCHSHTYDRETQGKYWLAACAVEEGETPFKQTKLEQFSHYPSYLLDMIPRYA
ncbi:hypothetical protein O9929_24680 [Vibrio lentus]|nr:hypothetical protein [Vibrio lentus]